MQKKLIRYLLGEKEFNGFNPFLGGIKLEPFVAPEEIARGMKTLFIETFKSCFLEFKALESRTEDIIESIFLEFFLDLNPPVDKSWARNFISIDLSIDGFKKMKTEGLCSFNEAGVFDHKVTPALGSVIKVETSEEQKFRDRVEHESKSSTNPFLRRWQPEEGLQHPPFQEPWRQGLEEEKENGKSRARYLALLSMTRWQKHPKSVPDSDDEIEEPLSISG